MDENPLSNQQQMQAALVSKAYLQDTAREQQRKLEQLEAMYAVAHNGLVSFLTLLDPDFIDTCLKQGQLVNKLDDRIVPQRVLAAIKKRKEKAGLPEGNHLEQGVPEPNWMTTWRQTKTLARDSVFLCLIGETGLSRQPSIKKLAAEKLDLRVDNGSLRKPVERMSDPDGPYLIEGIEDFEKAGSTAGGALPKFFRLTDRGRQAYWMLTGKNPEVCEYDRLIKQHKTPEHTFLNFRTMDILEEVGDYSIIIQTPDIRLPDGSQFVPDIVAYKNGTGELIYVDVERDTGKDTSFRVQKWINLWTASNGQIYVVCDTKRAVKALTSEINNALAGYTYRSHLTDLEELQAKKRGKDGSIWIYQR